MWLDKNMWKSKSFIITFAVVVVLGIVAGVIAYKIHQANIIAQGETLFRRGDYNGVIALLGPRVDETSGTKEERLLVARSYYRLRQYDKAQSTLDPLLRYGREEPGALALSGWIWLKKGSVSQAEERFNNLKASGETKYEAQAEAGLGGVALLRSKAGRNDELNKAKSHLTRTLTLSEPVPQTYMLLSEVQALQHEFEEAIQSAQKAVEMAPRWSEPYVILGQSYLLANQYDEAKEAFQRALQHGAAKEETKFHLAKSFYLQGHLEQAFNEMKELIAIDGENKRRALEEAAKIALVLQEQDTALRYLQDAWEIQKQPDTGMLIYEILTRLEQDEKAKTFIAELVDNWPFLSEAQLERGNRLLAQENLDEAYTAYNRVLDYDSQNFWACFNMGCITFRDRSQYRTVDFFSDSAQSAPSFFPALVNQVMALLASNKIEQARDNLHQLEERYPNDPYVLQAKALERFLAKDFETSLTLLDEFIQSKPQVISPWLIRGEIFMRLFQFQKAKECYQEALNIVPSSLRARLGFAHASFRLDEMASAMEAYQAVDDSFTDENQDSEVMSEARNGIALIKLSKNEIADALDIWDRLKTESELGNRFSSVNSTLLNVSDPTESEVSSLADAIGETAPLPEAYYNLAWFYEKLGQLENAANTYEQLIAQYPSYLPAIFNLADLYRKQGRIPDAVALFERARKAAPQRLDIINNEAAAYMKNNEYENAESLLKEGETIDPNSTVVKFNLALSSLKQDSISEAKEYLDHIKDLSATTSYTQIIEGLIAAKQDQWDKARALFADAQKENSENPYTALNHGVALVKLGRFTEAENALREAVSRDPSLAASHRALGLLYCKLGLYEEAEEILQVSVRLDPVQDDLKTIVEQIRGWMSGNGTNP